MAEGISSVVEALFLAKQDFKPLRKTGRNPHLKSDYATLADMMEACGPALNKWNLLVWWELATHATVLHLVHVPSKEQLNSCLPLTPAKQGDAQALGSWVSYSRRYTLNALLGLDCDWDDDGHAAKAPVEDVFPGAVATIMPDQVDVLLALADQTHTDVRKLCAYYKVDTLDALPLDLFPTVQAALKRKVGKP
jgi:hypothetical protein